MKRIICVMLTLIMLVSAVPATAITASAATMSTSASAVTVLKKMLSFEAYCYKPNGTNEYRIGYGSICPKSHTGSWDKEDHKINEQTATNMLARDMKKMDEKVNSFASSNSLSLKQGQFDALSVFSYLTGTAWMSGNGNVKTAVKNGADSTKLMNAFYAVLNKQYDDVEATTRSQVLVNMYFNGIYNNTPSENYTWVRYNANGGDMPVEGESFQLRALDNNKTYEMYFDASESVPHPVTPTKKGYKFLGWYYVERDTIGGRSTALDSSCKKAELIALWQGNGTDADNADKDYGEGGAVEVWYEAKTSSLASDNFYKKPSGDNAVRPNTSISKLKGDSVWIRKEYLAEDGSRWARTVDEKEWMLLSNAPGSSSGGGSGSSGVGYRTGVNVTYDFLNVRKEANIYSAKVDQLKRGDRVYISRTESRNGFLWGHAYPSRSTDEDLGWIALMYTDYNTAKDEDQSDRYEKPAAPANPVIAKATITYNGYVNMRDNAGTDNKIVGSLAKNEIVSVYEIKTVNGHQWGRTNGGWFCLTYANVQMLSGSSDISNSGSEAYTFTGVARMNLDVYESNTTESNFVDAVNAPKNGDKVSIITFNIRDGQTWAKIGWTYMDKDNDNENVTKYGWVDVGDNGSYSNKIIELDTVKFTVVANSVNVRSSYSSGSELLTKLDKGYEINVKKVRISGEEVWGETELSGITGGNGEKTSCWVNLASKYVQRSDLVGKDTPPAKEEEDNGRDYGTIVGADRVNVRADHKITALKVGQLGRGQVVEILDWEDGWFRVDADVDNNDDTESWVHGDYIEEMDRSEEIENAPSSHGTGVVANTYAGVNVRRGPGTAYAIVGTKLLPGTQVKILETTYTGITKWGRIDDDKWVCMDYIAMTNEVVDVPEKPKPEAPNGGEWVKDYDEIDRTTTTAVYTGTVKAEGGCYVWKSTERHYEGGEGDPKFIARTLNTGDSVTIYELIAVVEKTKVENGEDGTSTEETVTTYWARTNDGYILTPESSIKLDALDEKAHTLTGSDTLKVRPNSDGSGDPLGKLKKGDVVKVTALNIVKDKVWGKIEYMKDDVYVEDGWVRLDYMSEGAFYQEPEETKPETPDTPDTPAPPAGGNENSSGDVGKKVEGVYRYDGKIKSEVKLRAQASTASDEIRKLKTGEKIYIYETTLVGTMAWGRTDGGWVSLYYVEMTPRDPANGIETRLVYRPTAIYSDANRTQRVGSYVIQAVVDIYEIVGNMARTELGWIYTGDLL